MTLDLPQHQMICPTLVITSEWLCRKCSNMQYFYCINVCVFCCQECFALTSFQIHDISVKLPSIWTLQISVDGKLFSLKHKWSPSLPWTEFRLSGWGKVEGYLVSWQIHLCSLLQKSAWKIGRREKLFINKHIFSRIGFAQKIFLFTTQTAYIVYAC